MHRPIAGQRPPEQLPTAAHSRFATLAAFVLVGLLLTTSGQTWAGATPVLGWVEQISLSSEQLPMEAKIDTGADVSSVHVEAMQHLVRDGRPWVEFTLRGTNGEQRVLQRAIVRVAGIKLKTRGIQQRPVVLLQVCIGNRRQNAEFNLARRDQFRYPVLLGRSFLRGRYLVDSAAKHRSNRFCE